MGIRRVPFHIVKHLWTQKNYIKVFNFLQDLLVLDISAFDVLHDACLYFILVK